MSGIKIWGWILAILALLNIVRISLMPPENTVFNWIISLIVLMASIVLLSYSNKKQTAKKRKK